MEHPSSGVISDDTESDTVAVGDLNGITTDGVDLSLVDRGVQERVIRSVVLRALNDLELVSVQMADMETLEKPNVLKYRWGTHKGCFPASPFLSTMSKTSMCSRMKL